MSDIEKLEEIYNSYVNGQKSQMVEQIKAYGANQFAIDFYENIGIVLGFSSNPRAEYARILYTFNLLKNR